MSDLKSPSEPSMEEILATVRRIIAEDELGAARSSGGPPSIDGEVLELTEALEPDGSVRHLPPFGAVPSVHAEPRPSPMPDGRIEPTPPRPAAAKQEAGPPERAEPVAVIRERGTEREPSKAVDDPRLSGNRSLEELVRELLRPMLQRWLDENLPGLVERAVRAEVARLRDEGRLAAGGPNPAG
jgi:uncharacterized protein